MMDMQDLFFRLWDSATDLVIRFAARPSLKAALGKFNEEADEMKLALHELVDKPHSTRAREAAADEVADVFTALINAAHRAGLSLTDVEHGVRRTIEKNARKTPQTHYFEERSQTIMKRVLTDGTDLEGGDKRERTESG